MSLKSRARSGERAALEAIFRQFIPEDEHIEAAAFLGVKGILGIGMHSFGAVTDRRVASLELTMFGGAIYRDGYHEHMNSSVVYQPSKLYSYICSLSFAAIWYFALYGLVNTGRRQWILLGLIPLWFALGVALAPLAARLLHRYVKSGLVLVVREGVWVYCFTDRARLGMANELASLATEARDNRLVSISPRVRPMDGPTAQRRGSVAQGGRNVDPTSAQRASRRATRAGSVARLATVVVLIGAAGRLYALTQPFHKIPRGVRLPFGFHNTVWSGDHRLTWVIPAAACIIAACLALGRFSAYRGAAIAATVTSGLIVGLQTITDPFKNAVFEADAMGRGLRLTLLSGAVVTFAAVVVGVAAVTAGWLKIGELAWEEALRERVTQLVVLAGAVTIIGALMPWYRNGNAGRFWGGSASPLFDVANMRRWYLVFFVASTTIGMLMTVIASLTRSSSERGGLMAGWAGALLGWAIGIQISEDHFFLGFRVFQVGVGLTIVAAVVLILGTRPSVRLVPLAGAWPPPPPVDLPAPSAASVPTREPLVGTGRG